MTAATVWMASKLQSLGIVKEEHYELLCQLELEAKEMENVQREKYFIEGYKKRTELSGSIFDEISEDCAKILFKEASKS